MSLWSRSSPSAAVLYPGSNLEHFLLPSRLESGGLKVKKICFPLLHFCFLIRRDHFISSHSLEVLTHFPDLCIKKCSNCRSFNSLYNNHLFNYLFLKGLNLGSAGVLGSALACGPILHRGDRDICFDREYADITAATPVPALGRHISPDTTAGDVGEHKDPEMSSKPCL